MDNKEFSEKLANKLLSLKQYKAHYNGGRTWVVMRCMLCGDSKRDPNKTRLYVKVKFDENEMPIFYCHNCLAKGPVTALLPVLFPNDYELSSNVDVYMKRLRRSPKAKHLNFSKSRSVKILAPPNRNYNMEKIQYINKRLGIKLTNGDIKKFKLVVDFYDFLASNGIKNLTRDKRVCDCLQTDYVGFLTVNNEYINMRNIRTPNQIMKRYENYDIFNLEDTTKRIYVMSSEINIMERVEIHIAEGIFDILGVYYHLCNQDTNNKLYVAVCGSGYESVIRYLISNYGILFHDIHIYSDTDKPLHTYMALKKKLGARLDGYMKIYYNKLGKDFGVRKEEIDYKYTKI